MKKILLTAAVVALSASTAFAADLKLPVKAAPPAPPPSPWDIAFGGALSSDYMWRGITQSAHEPSVSAYIEPRYNINPNLQLYVGWSGESIDFPNRAAAEMDVYGGIRPTFGPLAFDIGVWGYLYPGGQCFNAAGPGLDCILNGNLPNGGVFANVAKKDWSFYEIYGHATWTINDSWALGLNFFYAPNILNTGADGEYLSGTVKFTAPSSMALAGGMIGWYVSGEVGEQWLGTSDTFYGSVPYADYLTWNVGVGFTWKVFTLDLRYWDTDLSKANCNVYTSDHTATFNAAAVTVLNPSGLSSNWCDARFVAKLSFDMTLGALK